MTKEEALMVIMSEKSIKYHSDVYSPDEIYDIVMERKWSVGCPINGNCPSDNSCLTCWRVCLKEVIRGQEMEHDWFIKI